VTVDSRKTIRRVTPNRYSSIQIRPDFRQAIRVVAVEIRPCDDNESNCSRPLIAGVLHGEAMVEWSRNDASVNPDTSFRCHRFVRFSSVAKSWPYKPIRLAPGSWDFIPGW
jgi:hypothetical protein